MMLRSLHGLHPRVTRGCSFLTFAQCCTSTSSHVLQPGPIPILPHHRLISQMASSKEPTEKSIGSKGEGKTGLQVYVDASNWGIGIVINKRWVAYPFLPTTSIPHINWAELLAIEAGVVFLIASGYISQIRNGVLKVYSDSISAIMAFETERENRFIWAKDILERLERLKKKQGLKLELEHVSTKVNLADGPSRGKTLSEMERLRAKVVLPPHLQNILGGVMP